MKYLHIGWCKEDKHDKVWGIILLAQHPASHESFHPFPSYKPAYNDYLTFWGRRGSKLQTKIWSGIEDQADELFDMKMKRGYKKIQESDLNDVYPEFQSDLEKTAIWATLKL